MPSISEIKKQIKELDHTETLISKREIQHLPEIIQKTENIKGLIQGTMNARNWLIVCTNQRIIFLNKGLFYGLDQIETPLEKISAIESHLGLIFGKISYEVGSSKIVIEYCQKNSVKSFVFSLSKTINTINSTTNNNNSEIHISKKFNTSSDSKIGKKLKKKSTFLETIMGIGILFIIIGLISNGCEKENVLPSPKDNNLLIESLKNTDNIIVIKKEILMKGTNINEDKKKKIQTIKNKSYIKK